MKAYVYGANGAAITDVPKPSPTGSQVLVKVHARGMNRADLGDIAQAVEYMSANKHFGKIVLKL